MLVLACLQQLSEATGYHTNATATGISGSCNSMDIIPQYGQWSEIIMELPYRYKVAFHK